MAVKNIPLWTFAPNWSTSVSETLEWLTDVMASPTGAEQRRMLRRYPRRSIEFYISRWAVESSLVRTLVDMAAGNEMYIPMWYTYTPLWYSVQSGEFQFHVLGENRELLYSPIIALQDAVTGVWNVAEVSIAYIDQGVTGFTLTAPLTASFAEGSRVYPLVAGLLDTGAFSYTQAAASVMTASVRFQLTEPTDWGQPATMPIYRDWYVFDLEPNFDGEGTSSYPRLVTDIDNTISQVVRVDVAGISFESMTLNYTIMGRLAHDQLRANLYTLRGRFFVAYFMSPVVDFVLVDEAVAGASTMTVQRNWYTDFGGPSPGRADIVIRLRNGQRLFRRIIGSALVGDSFESLGVDSPWPFNFNPADVFKISFLMPGRLDSDSVEIDHKTDADGVCTVALAIKRVPDLRVATDWS